MESHESFQLKDSWDFRDGSQILVEEDEYEPSIEEQEIEKTIDLEVKGEVKTESRNF